MSIEVNNYSGNYFTFDTLNTRILKGVGSINISGNMVPLQSGTDNLGSSQFPFRSIISNVISGNFIRSSGMDVIVSGLNLGTGKPLFAGKSGTHLNFVTVGGGPAITVFESGDQVIFNVTPNIFVNVTGDTMTGLLTVPNVIGGTGTFNKLFSGLISGTTISGNTYSVGSGISANTSGTVSIGSFGVPFDQCYANDWIREKPSFAFVYQSGNATATTGFTGGNFVRFSGIISLADKSTDFTPSGNLLIYNGTPKYFQITLNSNLSVSASPISASVGVFKNGVLVSGSETNTNISNLNAFQPCSSNVVITLASGNTTSPVVSNKTNTNSITCSYMNFTVREI